MGAMVTSEVITNSMIYNFGADDACILSPDGIKVIRKLPTAFPT